MTKLIGAAALGAGLVWMIIENRSMHEAVLFLGGTIFYVASVIERRLKILEATLAKTTSLSEIG